MAECRGSGYGMWRPGNSGGGTAQRRKHPCPECGREVSVNLNGRVRVHADLRGPKLTDTQLKVLRNLRDYDDVAVGFHGMSQMGGLDQSVGSLRRKGLVGREDGKLVMTDAGKQALADAEVTTK